MMFGLFNQKNSWRMAGQIVNTGALILAIYDLAQHPERALELVPDLASHALNVYALREQSNTNLEVFTTGVNLIRVGAIYGGVALGGTAVPLALNLIDVGNHLLSAGVLMLTTANEAEEQAIARYKTN